MRRALVAALAVALAACGEKTGGKTPFDGASAYAYVRTQLAFGPRIPGTEGHRKTGDWIVSRLRAAADTVIEQRFTHVTVQHDTLPLRNILARFRPSDPQRVLFITHWDTRPVSDQAPDSAQRKLPMPGANDGASGTAMQIALAEALKRTPPTVGVDLLFVDGEDYGSFNDRKDVLLGSQYFATHLPDSAYRPLYGVLWDMIGKFDTRFQQEGFSAQRAPEVVSLVWKQAAELGYASTFLPVVGGPITDDHVPLQEVGLHVIDVIDYDYPQHHTPADTLGFVSRKSLQIVGDVAYSLVVEKR